MSKAIILLVLYLLQWSNLWKHYNEIEIHCVVWMLMPILISCVNSKSTITNDKKICYCRHRSKLITKVGEMVTRDLHSDCVTGFSLFAYRRRAVASAFCAYFSDLFRSLVFSSIWSKQILGLSFISDFNSESSCWWTEMKVSLFLF